MGEKSRDSRIIKQKKSDNRQKTSVFAFSDSFFPI